MSADLKRIRTVPRLPQRAADSHKGTFGRILVIGGSRGMLGAPALVGRGALRSGAGLVSLAVPASIQLHVATLCPCATSIPLPETRAGMIAPARSRKLLEERGFLHATPDGTAPDALVIGPGIGQAPGDYGRRLWELIDAFRMTVRVPTVIDADALNLTGRSSRKNPAGWDARPHLRTIITPHPGELARMHGVTTRKIQGDRIHFAVRTATMMSASLQPGQEPPVVVLKGAGTVVTDGRRAYVNKTGNPGMATGGSGDVLAGVIAALLGQKMTSFDAAVCAVHYHGLAGDLAARQLGEVSVIASDLPDYLPAAFQSGSRRNRS